jgi:hypothetical protein
MIDKVVTWAVGPALPFLAGGVVVALGLGAWTINDRAYDRGVKAERIAWEEGAAATAAAYAEAAQEAAQLRETQRADVEQATTRVIERTRIHYATRPIDRDAVCLPADRVRSVLSARQAIATAAGGSVGGATDTDAGDSDERPEAPQR